MADEHVIERCPGKFIELHRIDPEESRPPLGTQTVNPDGTMEFKPKLKDGEPVYGARKYEKKVIIYYCPVCGAKKEEPWK